MRTIWIATLAGIASLLALPAAATSRNAAKVIVLIGGSTPHGPGNHDSHEVIGRLAGDLATSPDIRAMRGVTVRAFPDGWPQDPGAFARAATIVWYFDGLEHHPMLDPAHHRQLARLMRRGVGLVALHQAVTLPADDRDIDLVRWLGAARYGMVDRTVEDVGFTPAAHAITHGVGPFRYRDEFYPTLRFGTAPVTPILAAPLHREAAPAEPPALRTVAWAFERPGGGRAFGFTGLHYTASLDQPALRTLLLNAIVWTAGLDVPAGGVR